MPAILAIAVNDLRLLARDKAALFFTLFFPLGLAVFFGAIFGGGGGGSKLDVALVLEEDGPKARAFAEALSADSSLDVVRQTDAGTPLTRDEGETLVRKGAVSACVVVPKGFGGGIESIFAGGGIKLEGYVAPGRGAEAGLLTGKLNELAFRQMASGLSDPAEMTGMLDRARSSLGGDDSIPDENRRLLTDMFDRIGEVNKTFGGLNPGAAGGGDSAGSGGWMPVQVSLTELKDESDRPRSSWEVSFPQGVVWALMGCVTGFGVSMSGERSRGTLLRLSVAPISRGQLLLGKAAACFFACLAVQALLIALAAGVFGGLMGQFRVGNPLMLAAAMMVSAIGFTGLMMLLAGLTRTEGGASGLGRGLIIVLAMIGGGSIPLFLLPGWVQTVSSISPFKWATISIEGAIWRGFTWADCALPFGVLLGCGVLGFAIGASALKPAERA
ncbi:MAG: ABC transporter permease [Leptolyngbya sp. PLA1]|nr:ABC transporter permease [Leptolyngbya sp. PLA1]